MKTAMKFKTLEGARKRAAFENADAKHLGKPYRFRVTRIVNPHQPIENRVVWVI